MLDSVARIRIIDEWLRSPVSPPSRYRSIMVVAESWAEQRVLMRAYSNSPDQTRPTIVLHGSELAVGPAGIEPYGQWGIHVEPPVDGRAQELKAQLELAARRLAGSKGNPPRLEDELPKFERKRTNHWAPGTPRDLPPQALGPTNSAPGTAPQPPWQVQTRFNSAQAAAMAPVAPPVPGYYEPMTAVSAADHPAGGAQMPTVVVGPPPGAAPPPSSPTPPAGFPAARTPPARTPPASFPAARTPPAGFPAARKRRKGWTSPIPLAPAREVGSTTAMGFAGGPQAGADSSDAGLSQVVGHTMPLGFRLSPIERDVLNRLGEADSLTARQIGEIAGVTDPVAWMEALMSKLAERGLDLVAPGSPVGGEPTYRLRR